MILHRLAAAIRHQNWFTVLVELSLIVLGVFLGIQVSNWNEVRLDRQLEAQVIARLTTEFRELESNSLSRLSYFVGNTEELRSLVLQLDEIREKPDLTLLVRRLLAAMAPLPGGTSATYQEMLSAGNLGIIQSGELRNALSTFATRHNANDASVRLNWDIAIGNTGRLLDLGGLAIAIDQGSRERELLEKELVKQLEQDDDWILQIGLTIALHRARHANEMTRLAAVRAVLYELGQEPMGGAAPEIVSTAEDHD
jgi:hypothetical protein